MFTKASFKHNKYFEVWGDLLAHSNTLKLILIGAVICNIIQLLFIFLLANRPPMIIRIDKLGRVDTIKNYVTETMNVSEEDIRDFARQFVNSYTAVRSDHVAYQMKEALNMMTKEYQEQHLKNIRDTNIIEEIQIADIRNEITFNEMSVEIAKKTIYLKINALLKTSSLTDVSDKADEKHVMIRMILQKVSKSANTPFGLLVKGYKLDFSPPPEIGNLERRDDE